MDPLSIGLGAAQFALPIIGGLIGQALSAGDQEQAERLYRMASEQYNIPVPDLQQYVAHNVTAQNVNEDPAMRASQTDALGRFEQLSRDGLGDIDRANLNDITTQQDQHDRGAREALQAQFARRGGLNSGMALASQLQAQQDGAQAANARGLGVAAQGQQRRMSALDQYAQLAGNIRGDDFRREQDRVARDIAVQQFNERNRADAVSQNNAAAQAGFGMRMDLGHARAGAYGAQGDHFAGRAQNTRNLWSGVGSGAGQAAGGMQNYLQNERSRNDMNQMWQQWLASQGGH